MPPRKGKKREDNSNDDLSGPVYKPGLTTHHAHIASMFASAGQHDVAESLTYPLLSHIAERVLRPVKKGK